MQVTQDQSIMAIGDFKGAADFEPSLSTVRIPADYIGQRAAEILLGRMSDATMSTQRIAVEIELIARNSTMRYAVR